MLAYDLDDTLADTNYDNVMGQASLIDMIRSAEVTYQPRGQFAIITARGTNPEVHRATAAGAKENLPGCQAIYYTTGSGETGMKNKLEVIKRHNLEGYVDASVENLNIMRKLDPQIKLYTITDNKLVEK